jgi:hypothetical protein
MEHIIFLVVALLLGVILEHCGLCLLSEDDKKTPLCINFVFLLTMTVTGYTA